jgi:hypothetical protein
LPELARSVTLLSNSTSSDLIGCESGLQVPFSPSGSSGVVSAGGFTAPFDFIAFSGPTNASTAQSCVCGGGSGLQTVEQKMTFYAPNGNSATFVVRTTQQGSTGCVFAGTGATYSDTRTDSIFVGFVTNSQGDAVAYTAP